MVRDATKLFLLRLSSFSRLVSPIGLPSTFLSTDSRNPVDRCRRLSYRCRMTSRGRDHDRTSRRRALRRRTLLEIGSRRARRSSTRPESIEIGRVSRFVEYKNCQTTG